MLWYLSFSVMPVHPKTRLVAGQDCNILKSQNWFMGKKQETLYKVAALLTPDPGQISQSPLLRWR